MCVILLGEKYGSRRQWKGFEVHKDWLIPIEHNGYVADARVLIIEAGTTIGGMELVLCSSKPHEDLSLQEASQAFDMIERLGREQGGIRDNDRVARILLADSHMKQTSGGGGVYDLRELVAEQNMADIIIDARAPLLSSMLKWAENAWIEAAKMQGLEIRSEPNPNPNPNPNP